MWTFMVVFILLTGGYNAQIYDNSFTGYLFRKCPDGEVLSEIRSTHSTTYTDRRWKIECKVLQSVDTCTWSGFYNLYDQELGFKCPANQMVSGVYSDYKSAFGDRRFNFYCCSFKNTVVFDCRDTPTVNYWNEDFTWPVPGDNVLTGVHTHGKNSIGDHRWSFSYCRTTQDTMTVNSQILAANAPVSNLLFTQGDVPVLNAQSTITCPSCSWPKSTDTVLVPLSIDDDFTAAEKKVITDAISSFQLNTCIRFVPHKHQTSYISVVKGHGCWSFVGRTGGAQQLSLGGGCVQHGIIQHELMHSLGFWHEQSRSDRDIYVRVNYENIEPGRERNFDRVETYDLKVPYDYSSVLHYGANDFSANGQDTITVLTPSETIGQRFGMSENDLLKINRLYSCKKYLPKYDEWDNVLDGVLSHQCPSGQAVSRINSFHSNSDRLWGISCKGFHVTRTCRWSGYVNEHQGSVDFECNHNQVIAGVYSDHSSTQKDRRWKFYCCSAKNFSTFNCKNTAVVNYWGEHFNWPVPGSNFLTGVKSSFNAQTRDRRWSFTYCQERFE